MEIFMEDIFNTLKEIKFDEIQNKDFIEFKELCTTEANIRNSTILKCPKFGVKGNEPNMLRWHFENCETKLRCCEQCGNTIPRQGIKPFLYDVKKYCNRKCYMESKKGKAPIVMTDEVKNKLSKIALTQSEERSERIKMNAPWEKRWKKKI
jgi:ERCC4-related helicase